MFLAFDTSWGMSLASVLPMIMGLNTFLFALVEICRSDYGAFVVYDDDALHILVGLHAIEGLLHLRHPLNLNSCIFIVIPWMGVE